MTWNYCQFVLPFCISHKHAGPQPVAQVQWWTLHCECGFHWVVGTVAVFPQQWRFQAGQSPSFHWWWRRQFWSAELEENPTFIHQCSVCHAENISDTVCVCVCVCVCVSVCVSVCLCVSVYPGSFGSLLSPVCWCFVLLQESLQSYGSQRGGKYERNSPSPLHTPANTHIHTRLCTQSHRAQTLYMPACVHAQTVSACSLYRSFTITGMCFNSTIINSAGSHCCSFSLIFTHPSCSPTLSPSLLLEIPQLTQSGPTVGLSWGTFLVFLSIPPLHRSPFCKFRVYFFCSLHVMPFSMGLSFFFLLIFHLKLDIAWSVSD